MVKATPDAWPFWSLFPNSNCVSAKRVPFSGNEILRAETKAPERDVRTKFSSTETKRRCGSAPNRSYSRGSRKSLLARECVVALRGTPNRQPNGYELRLPMNVFGRASIEAETNGSVFPCECPVKHRDLSETGGPERFRTPDPQIRSLMTPITHPIVRAPWPAGYCSRRAHRGLEIKAAADPARGGAPRLTAHSRNLFRTFRRTSMFVVC